MTKAVRRAATVYRMGSISVLPVHQIMSFWQVSTSLRAALLVDLSSAIIGHQWFRKYEPDNITDCLLQLAIFAIAPVVMAAITFQSPLISVPLHLMLFVSFLLSSILLYRIGPFHPLAKYPGPILCKISKIWGAFLSHKGKLHWYYHELHKKYGPVVRVGPNELSIVDVNLLPNILGQQGMPKGPLWDGRAFLPPQVRNTQMSLISVRDYNVHTQLRKPWNRSFGPNALQDYEESLIATGNELVELLKDRCRKSDDKFGHVDLAEYIGIWSFDFMGNMAFGEGFGAMRTGDKDGLVLRMKIAAEAPAITQMIPWAMRLFRALPYYKKRLGSFTKFAIGQAQKRITKVTEKKDLFYHLAAGMNIDDDKPPTPYLISNVVLAIVAGSDTTSTVLAGIMFNLIQYPDYFKRLRKELDGAFPPSERAVIKPDQLVNLEMLNAIVNETLRLQPPVLTNLQRAPAKNSGGKLLGDMFIHEGTAVCVPPYVMHRDPRYFYPKTEEFWPERWLIQNDDNIILNRSAFIPFSYGPANCAGKTLAISELRYITAMLVYNFEFAFEDGYDPSLWSRDIIDQFVIVVGKLPVKLRQRTI